MKAKVILIASAAVIGIGATVHISGHAPKCLFKKSMPAVTKKAAISLNDQSHMDHEATNVAKLHQLK